MARHVVEVGTTARSEFSHEALNDEQASSYRVVPFRPRRQAVRHQFKPDSLDVVAEPFPSFADRLRRRDRSLLGPQRYLVSAIAVAAAVVVLGVLVFQLGQAGKTAEPPGAAASSEAAAPASSAAENSAAAGPSGGAAPAVRPGEGPLRSSIRVVQPGYTVAADDTLSSIARRFGTTIEVLQAINNLPDRNVISVGQRLVIPNQD